MHRYLKIMLKHSTSVNVLSNSGHQSYITPFKEINYITDVDGNC